MTHLSLRPVTHPKGSLTRIGVSAAVRGHGRAAGGRSVARRRVDQLGPLARLAASEATGLRVLDGAERGLRQLFLRPGTAVQSFTH